MTQAGIPLGHLVTSIQCWARHLYTSDLRPLPGVRWVEDAGTGEGVLTLDLVIPQLPSQVFFQGPESRWESKREYW